MKELKSILNFELAHLDRVVSKVTELKSLDLTKFDGKQQNVYLERALDMTKDNNGRFTWYDENRWLSLPGPSNGYYLESSTYTIYNLSGGYFDKLPPFDLALFTAQIDKDLQQFTTRRAKLAADIKALDKHATKLKKLVDGLNSYTSSIDYTVFRKLTKKLHLSVRGF